MLLLMYAVSNHVLQEMQADLGKTVSKMLDHTMLCSQHWLQKFCLIVASRPL